MNRKPFPWHIVVFLAPAILIYTTFMIYPLVDSLRLSLFAPNETGQEVFVGLSNYTRLFTNELWAPRMWGALRNNFIFFAIHMLVHNPIAPFLASLLS